MPPLLFVAMRFVLVVFPCIFFIRKPDVSWKAIIGVGLFMSAGQFGLLYLAMALGMPAGLASLVLQAQVLLTILLAAVFLGERPSRRQVAGVVLGVAGLAVVAIGRSPVAPVLPLMIVLAAALSWAAGNVVARQAKAASGLGLVVWSGAVVPLPLAGLSLAGGRPGRGVHVRWATCSRATILSALYTAVFASLVGYGIWNRLLGLLPVLRRGAVYAAGPGGGDERRLAGAGRGALGGRRWPAGCCSWPGWRRRSSRPSGVAASAAGASGAAMPRVGPWQPAVDGGLPAGTRSLAAALGVGPGLTRRRGRLAVATDAALAPAVRGGRGAAAAGAAAVVRGAAGG